MRMQVIKKCVYEWFKNFREGKEIVDGERQVTVLDMPLYSTYLAPFRFLFVPTFQTSNEGLIFYRFNNVWNPRFERFRLKPSLSFLQLYKRLQKCVVAQWRFFYVCIFRFLYFIRSFTKLFKFTLCLRYKCFKTARILSPSHFPLSQIKKMLETFLFITVCSIAYSIFIWFFIH